jgi:hypothetical protein
MRILLLFLLLIGGSLLLAALFSLPLHGWVGGSGPGGLVNVTAKLLSVPLLLLLLWRLGTLDRAGMVKLKYALSDVQMIPDLVRDMMF